MSYISIKNLNFNFDKNILFDNINFDIKKGSINVITTPSSRGKTTILNIISGNIKTDNVFIEDKLLNDKIRSKITIINKQLCFYSKTVLEELLLVSINISKIRKYLKEFNLLEFINESPLNLNFIQMQKLNLIKALLKKSEIILMDNIFSYFDKYSKIEFMGYLKKYQSEKNITIIYTTNNLEDAIFTDKILIIDRYLLYDGNFDKFYLDEKLIKKSRLNVPLQNELVEKLNLYNVIDGVNYTIEEVVDEICK